MVDLQKSILVQIELSRRRLADVQSKKEVFEQEREECWDFLVLSAEIDTNNFRSKNEFSMNEVASNLLGSCNIKDLWGSV